MYTSTEEQAKAMAMAYICPYCGECEKSKIWGIIPTQIQNYDVIAILVPDPGCLYSMTQET